MRKGFVLDKNLMVMGSLSGNIFYGLDVLKPHQVQSDGANWYLLRPHSAYLE